ncbi:hypothetical protein H8D76_02075 [Candidatus Bathyarchaeota archaeon]|nr:hypothetical protein [Candidatus Bathyarchaeota archaeon]
MSDLTGSSKSALSLYALKNPMVKMRIGEDDTYLSRGLFSDENRVEIEDEIKRLKVSALEIAREIITEYHDQVVDFTENQLVKKEIMVRSEILEALSELNIEPGKYYDVMCQALKKLDYPV